DLRRLRSDAGLHSGIDLSPTLPEPQRLGTHAQQPSDVTERTHHVRVRRPRLREHPERPLAHLRQILPVHRVPSLLEERNESQADSHSIEKDTPLARTFIVKASTATNVNDPASSS